MKKLFGLTIALMLGLNIVGCENTMEDTTIEEPKTKQEQTIEVEETEEETEEVIDIFDEEKFNYYMTTNLSDSEYEAYFSEIQWVGDNKREIEFDGQILMVTPHEKWNTRCELLLATGDYTDGNFTGPYIKTRDIGYTELDGMINPGYNVKVTATIEEYDINSGWLKITIKTIEQR